MTKIIILSILCLAVFLQGASVANAQIPTFPPIPTTPPIPTPPPFPTFPPLPTLPPFNNTYGNPGTPPDVTQFLEDIRARNAQFLQSVNTWLNQFLSSLPNFPA